MRWRLEAALPPHAQLITVPYDRETRFATKREISWAGYKVHLTETCDADAPHLITNGETTPATNDLCMTETIHTYLAQRARLPQEHLLDSGYVAADLLVR